MTRLRFTFVALGALVSSHARAQEIPSTALRPVTAPVIPLEGTLDLSTGRFTRTRGATRELGSGGKEVVYDNTCAIGFYLGLQPAGPGGTGSGCPETLGDYGGVPATGFQGGTGTGDGFCAPGCADVYDITEFEISWCQLAGPASGAQILVHFWNAPETTCIPGTSSVPTGGSCVNGFPSPTTPTLFSTTLSGLPRNNMIGTLACYTMTISVTGSGFALNGSQDLGAGPGNDDTFAWSFTMPTTTGADGPILAGDAGATLCAPCVGTIFEVGGATTSPGTGAGQTSTLFFEDYGGSSVPGTGSCVVFSTPGSHGIYLSLGAESPCPPTPPSTSFCDGPDGSLASCPCSNPGLPLTGCDVPIPVMQGGGLTGGVLLQAVSQQTSPSNSATLESHGFPTGSAPTGIVFRNTGIDPGSPVTFGDGLLCVDATTSPGTLVRLGPATASGGSMTSVVPHGAMAGSGTFYYQLWFRSTPMSYCDPTDEYNLSNGLTLTW